MSPWYDGTHPAQSRLAHAEAFGVRTALGDDPKPAEDFRA